MKGGFSKIVPFVVLDPAHGGIGGLVKPERGPPVLPALRSLRSGCDAARAGNGFLLTACWLRERSLC